MSEILEGSITETLESIIYTQTKHYEDIRVNNIYSDEALLRHKSR